MIQEIDSAISFGVKDRNGDLMMIANLRIFIAFSEFLLKEFI